MSSYRTYQKRDYRISFLMIFSLLIYAGYRKTENYNAFKPVIIFLASVEAATLSVCAFLS
jgi:hypothetical protein